MYKIIAIFAPKVNETVSTKVWSYRQEEDAIKAALTFKDRILSMGARIIMLRIYKTEEIGFPGMI